MDTFIVIATFDATSDLSGMMAVVAEEVVQVEVLRGEGRLGFVHLSPARGTVFLEIHADDVAAAEATAGTLPMSPWWQIDVYPLAPAPVGPGPQA